MKQQNNFPPGWDEERVKRVIEPYDSLTEEARIAHDEAAYDMDGQTVMTVPTELAPAVEKLPAQYELERPAATATTD